MVVAVLGYLIGFSLVAFWQFWNIRDKQEMIEDITIRTRRDVEHLNLYILKFGDDLEIVDKLSQELEDKEAEIEKLRGEVQSLRAERDFYRGIWFNKN